MKYFWFIVFLITVALFWDSCLAGSIFNAGISFIPVFLSFMCWIGTIKYD